MKIIVFAIILIYVQACSSEQSIYKKSENVNNTIYSQIPKNWNRIENEGSDFALVNNISHSIFVFNSSCRKNEGSNLNALTSSILSGIEQLSISENKLETIQNRDAKIITASGKLDGVMRFFKIATLQKNNCIYDYSLISTKKKYLEDDSDDFKKFINGIIIN